MEEKEPCWWECKLIQALWRTVWMFLKKLKVELLYDPTITLLSTYPQKTVIQKYTGTPMFTQKIYISESLCYIPESNTALEINYTSIKKFKNTL